MELIPFLNKVLSTPMTKLHHIIQYTTKKVLSQKYYLFMMKLVTHTII